MCARDLCLSAKKSVSVVEVRGQTCMQGEFCGDRKANVPFSLFRDPVNPNPRKRERG